MQAERLKSIRYGQRRWVKSVRYWTFDVQCSTFAIFPLAIPPPPSSPADADPSKAASQPYYADAKPPNMAPTISVSQLSSCLLSVPSWTLGTPCGLPSISQKIKGRLLCRTARRLRTTALPCSVRGFPFVGIDKNE